MNRYVKSFLFGVLLLLFVVPDKAAKSSLPNPSVNQLWPSPLYGILTIAHRGASGYAPEHTMPAYEMAKNMGADYLELDLQMTKDGYFMIMHDPTVDRTTNGKGSVKNLTREQIQRLDAGSWFNSKYPKLAKPEFVGLKVPTLEEVIQTFGQHVNYYIEIKNDAIASGLSEKLLGILTNHELIGDRAVPGKVIVESFNPEILRKIHQMNPSVPLVQLLAFRQSAALSESKLQEISKYAVGIAPDFRFINEGYVRRAREFGLLIHPYTVNDKTEMKHLLGWGVTGMFTNYPDKLREAISEVS